MGMLFFVLCFCVTFENNVVYSRRYYSYAAVAQLVEHQLPKLRVAGSSPVCRSNKHKI